ncbi:hypothetical protein DFQ26_005128 [Actinomortierella ambigua]|nr:hypothetical protein DFQ26_005128 [Actinomortierella ambigua]
MTEISMASVGGALYSKHNVHAMDIPMVADRVAMFLDFRDISRCALVSKQWNDNFEPVLWRHTTRMSDWPERQQRMTEAAIERNAHHMESLRVAQTTPHRETLLKHATNLKQLAVHFHDPQRRFPTVDKARLIQRNKGLVRLALIQGWFNWISVTPASHSNLRYLVLHNCQIERHSTRPFWELMTNLESIELTLTAIPDQDFHPVEWTFSKLRSITISRLPPLRRWHMRGRTFCDWIGKCPNLERLILRLSAAFTIPGDYLATVIRQNRIPLRAFDIGSYNRIHMDDLDDLMDAVDGLREFRVNQWMLLGQATCNRLLMQANTLTHVCFRQAGTLPIGSSLLVPISSMYQQQILHSCPNLIEFYGRILLASDMLSSPWVCSKLRVLVLFIEASHSPSHPVLDRQIWVKDTLKRIPQPGSEQQSNNNYRWRKGNNRYYRKRCNDPDVRASLLEHAAVYDRLSRLSDLEELDLSYPLGFSAAMAHKKFLSMRFLAGFGKLGRLRKLRVFGRSCLYHDRAPTVMEMNWIVGWKQRQNKDRTLQETQIESLHRPWLHLERLRWNNHEQMYQPGYRFGQRPLWYGLIWYDAITGECRSFQIDRGNFHPTAEMYLGCNGWQMPNIEPESFLTDSEIDGDH